MSETKKVTKTERYAEIRDIVEASEVENKDEILDFIDRQVQLLKDKATRAAEAAAKKKADGDALRETVYIILTDEFQSIEEITDQVEEEDVTKAKVTARLTQLIKAGMAEKDTIKTEDGRRVSAYRKAVVENTVTTA